MSGAELLIAVHSSGVWRMWPAHDSGVGAISVHPTDAYFLEQRGSFKMNGQVFTVEQRVSEEGDGNVMLRIRCAERFCVPHP